MQNFLQTKEFETLPRVFYLYPTHNIGNVDESPVVTEASYNMISKPISRRGQRVPGSTSYAVLNAATRS